MSKAADLANLIGNIDLSSSTNSFKTLDNLNNGGGSSNKNVIINGAMNVAQRGTSTTGLGADGTSYNTVDRFQFTASGTAGRFTQTQDSSAPSGFSNSLKFDCTTADTSIAAGELLILSQLIEGQNLQHFAKGTSDAKPFAVSFYVKGNASATYVAELYDYDNNRCVSKTFSVTTDWTRVELSMGADTTGAFDDDNAVSLYLNIWLHGGSNFTSGTLNTSWNAVTQTNRAVGISSFFDSTDRTFFLTGVQVEAGENPTDFEAESFELTQRKCQRYYVRAGGANYKSVFGVAGIANTTSSWFGYGQIPVPMRANYTMTITGTLRIQNGQAGYTASSISGQQSEQGSNTISMGCNASSLTLYRWHNMDTADGAAVVELEAEL
tara:strand:+ start:137 stop:1276 length:1140 start_codon:yes stop_codon:yes gene_type:complete